MEVSMGKSINHVTKEVLEKLYVDEQIGCLEISRILKVSKSTITLRLNEYGLTRKNGTKKPLDIQGKKFNKLTAIRLTDIRKHKQKVWECRCDCGNICYFDAYLLNRGYAKSCGCLHDRKGTEHPLWKGIGDLGQHHFGRIEQSAKKRGHEFSLTKEYLWNLYQKQEGKCALSGVEIRFRKHHKDTVSASLDRIDSTKGYVVGNVQWVHKDVNKMKWELSEEIFLNFCEKIYKHKILSKQ